jgi:hypothetical protein
MLRTLLFNTFYIIKRLYKDINYSNFYLDYNLDLKLSDFAESSINQLLALVCYSTTHQLLNASPLAVGEV